MPDFLFFLDGEGRPPSEEELNKPEWKEFRKLTKEGLAVRSRADSLLAAFRTSGYEAADKRRVLDVVWTNYQAFQRGWPFAHGIIGGGPFNETIAPLVMPDASWDCFWLVRYEKSRGLGTFIFISPEGRIRGYCGYSSSLENESWTDSLAPRANCCSLHVRLYEGHASAGREPHVVLQLTIQESYGGKYPRIRTRVRRHGNVIDVEDLGLVWPPGDAFGHSFSNASSMDSFDLSTGDHLLRVMCLDRTESYSLTITERAIVLSPEEVHCTKVDRRPYWRHPRNSFALYCKAPTEERWMCEELLRRVRTQLEFEEFSFPDSGVACYSPGLGSGGQFFPGHFFKYSSEAEFLKLDDFLREFSNEVGARWPFVEIWVTDWKRRGFANRDYPR